MKESNHESLNEIEREIYNFALKYREVVDATWGDHLEGMQQDLRTLVNRIAKSFWEKSV